MGRANIGDIEVFIFPDCYRNLDAKLFRIQDQSQEDAVKAFYPEGHTRISLNVFLIESKGQLTLVDTGCGNLLGPDCCGLSKNLAALGVPPDQITSVVITHSHFDHIGGLEADGESAFPNANVYLSQLEHDFWLNSENMDKVAERLRSNFAITQKMLSFYPGKVRTFIPGQEILPGLHAIAAYGHTPGHVAILVNSKGENLLIFGDLLHALTLQLARPDITIAFDSDPVEAVLARKTILAHAVKKNWAVTGAHVPGPEAYLIQSNREGFELVP